MSGRGRGGRGGRGGTNKSFSKEQLTSLGIAGNDVVPGPVSQPPPLYPMLERKPVPLTNSLETDYLLILRQDYIDHMQLSAAYLKLPESKINNPEHEIDKLIAQIPNTRGKFDWSLFPTELRPKMVAKRSVRKVVLKSEADVTDRLNKLEALELAAPLDSAIKEEVEETPEEEQEVDIVEDPEDEEMDDGTDYANNYFDNGEAYEDEDDNLDDGPIY